jgi:hypothetical protein
MGVREESLELLRSGHTPGDIARMKGVSLKTTLAYLDQMVGEGRLRRSDIFFSIPKARRANPRHAADGDVVRQYGDARLAFGDMYDDIRRIETWLHDAIRQELEAKFGPGEQGWWRNGIPLPIRKSCQERREEDSDPALEPYCYTDLSDLRQVFESKWASVSSALPTDVSRDKRVFLTDPNRLNQIRRGVMHPVRGNLPTEEDFEFLRGLRQALGI